jgi:hypothetical protein
MFLEGLRDEPDKILHWIKLRLADWVYLANWALGQSYAVSNEDEIASQLLEHFKGFFAKELETVPVS